MYLPVWLDLKKGGEGILLLKPFFVCVKQREPYFSRNFKESAFIWKVLLSAKNNYLIWNPF